MVSRFDRDEADVDFSKKGLITGNASVNLVSGTGSGGISGYPWRLQFPTDSPDPTVVIDDGRALWEFTNVQQLSRGASGDRNVSDLDTYFYGFSRTGFEPVNTTIGGTDYSWQLHLDGAPSDPITLTIDGTDHTFTGVDQVGEDVYAQSKQ